MNKNLQDLSNDELLKELNKSKLFLGLYLGLVLIMIIAGIISTIRKGINTFTFLPIPFAFIALVLFWSKYDKVRKELKARNLHTNQ